MGNGIYADSASDCTYMEGYSGVIDLSGNSARKIYLG